MESFHIFWLDLCKSRYGCTATRVRVAHYLAERMAKQKRDVYTLMPESKQVALSLPRGMVEKLISEMQQLLTALPTTKNVEIGREINTGLLHPLTLLPDRLQDVLRAAPRAEWEIHDQGIEVETRLRVMPGMAFLQATLWREDSLEILEHEMALDLLEDP